jgi:hypothetical protein
VRVYSVQPRAFSPVRGWLEQVEALWQTQLEAFKAHTERLSTTRGSAA